MNKKIRKLYFLTSIIFLFNIVLSHAGTIQYQYDDLHRLTRVERSDGTVTIYNYDELGNRTSMIVTSSSDTIYYCDNDTDGYYNSFVDGTCSSGSNCPPANCQTTQGNDCDDSDSLEHPNQTWYADIDGDGYSDSTTDTTSCTRPAGYYVQAELTDITGDCDDTNSALNPLTNWYPDSDADSYGDESAIPLQQCSQPLGDVLDNTDCNDNDPAINPGATEGPVGDATCSDTIDNDCDTYVDFADSDCRSSSGGSISLPKTGQTTCYDSAGTIISCAGTGQDGEIQAGVAWPDPRFTVTYCDATAPCADQSSDCDGNASTDVVMDNLTGLMWARDGNLGGSRSWDQSLDYANSLSLCGNTDWVLPNVNELKSLSNSAESSPSAWLNGQGFVNVQASYYHQSTSCAFSDPLSCTFIVSMGGTSLAYTSKSILYPLWPVRLGQQSTPDPTYPSNLWETGQTTSYYSGDDGALQRGVAWPVPRFIDNGDGTVTDNLTGLIWLKDANCFGGKPWQGAFDTVADFNVNPGNYTCIGYDSGNSPYHDWRLPNEKEMLSLYDRSQSNPALQSGHLFVNVALADYWSSTSYLSNAVGSYMAFGTFGQGPKSNSFVIWPVRGGGAIVPIAYFCDGDSDGYANSVSDGTCSGANCPPQGCQAIQGNDCDDIDPNVYPGANEVCSDTIDNDCDGLIDDLDTDCYIVDYYCDTDSDGHIALSASGTCTGIGCEPAGCQTTPGDDCDDIDNAAYPGAPEMCGDGIDQDCIGGDVTCESLCTTWERATGSAGWAGRYGHASVIHDGKIWVMGGSNITSGRLNDVWSSSDGTNWSRTTPTAQWTRRDGLQAVSFNGKIWVLTGYSEYSEGGYRTDVFSSIDGINWSLETDSPGWEGRDWASVTVFNEKIWLMGGGNDSGRLNDIWYSSDGVNWTLATGGADWTRRQSAAAVVYNGKMWILGGYTDSGPANDVWYSSNGVNWTPATSSAEWPARSGHTAVVSGGKMWVMGGYSGGSYINDVWYSTDGVNWTEATSSAGWAGRTTPVSVVHNGGIWVLGGAGLGTYYNDVWYLPSTSYYMDADGDGYGDPAISISPCTTPFGYVLDNTDCNDNVPTVYPGAIEVCDNNDNDCNTGTADGSGENWYSLACDGPDSDACQEGTYQCTNGTQSCSDNTGNNLELCNGADDDCDGVLDGSENLTQQCGTTDVGECSYGTESCDDSGNWVGCTAVFPSTEICDGSDNNCDGYTDEGFDNDGDTYTTCNGDCDDTDPAINPDTVWYEDFDVDGFGTLSNYMQQCNQPAGYVLNSTDCDDVDSSVYPGSTEICDGRDNNCNGTIDDVFNTWEKTFGGQDWEKAYAVEQTSDGGYVITGETFTFGSGAGDMYLIKTDADGNKIWEKTFGGADFERGDSVRQTIDGGYILVGRTYSYGPGLAGIYLVKTDSDGNKIWQNTFGGGMYDYGFSVKQTSDEGYIISGTYNYGSSHDMYLIKIDSGGNQIWEKTFGGSGAERGRSVLQNADGSYIVAGYTTSYGSGNYDVYIIKTDTSGNKIWEKTFGGTDDDLGHSIQQTSDGGYIITGETRSYGAGNYDIYLIKTDSDGNKIWEKTYGGIGEDAGRSVFVTSDGGYIIAGWTNSYGSGNYDAYLIKTDTTGNKIWEKTFGGTDEDRADSVLQSVDGNYMIAGNSLSFGAGNYDMYLVKTGIDCPDQDGDTIPDDGDRSGTAGDNPCTGGITVNCDDNCLNTPNSNQADADNDGVGDVCDNCTDVDGDSYAIEGGSCGTIDCDDSDASINPGATEIPNNGIDEDCDPSTYAEVSGSGYNYPEPGFRASLSLDVRAASLGTSWLNYYYSKLRINLESTLITGLSVAGNTITITGEGTVNGVAGYTFTVTITDGNPDTIEIIIYNPDGTVYFISGAGALISGDFNVVTDNTIQYQLTTSVSPVSSGSITPDCSGGCFYSSGADTILNAKENNGYSFSDWTGCDSPSNNLCTITMDADKSVTANFQACPQPVRIAGATPVYYSSLQAAYDAAVDGDTIQTQALNFTEDLNINIDKSVVIQGGFDCNYTTIIGNTTLNGDIAISNGTITIENLILGN